MSDLLKESIADAKAVRETALANAKTFLEENFAASMKEMFADKLKEEMAEEADPEEDTIEEKLGSSNIGKDDGLTAKTQRPVKPSPVANKNTTAAGKQEFGGTLGGTRGGTPGRSNASVSATRLSTLRRICSRISRGSVAAVLEPFDVIFVTA